ncbi:TIGR01621 family pseudouridine synthase [Gallaecimonas xiamenensis]|uniref:Pseudouridine synthase Rlu family protein n=1 Tax=Gallaecimonas xiamenensis 3-C-1 TaxID=745411 RepID=K2IXH0_9GAMM|nr:TIGR01621 family pseudouridine synthase [Gallaecimonas xiamenensis]EKE75131.1 pseudouridine synthase Rlu family protein [Gallaecimonas xiamenensis 3-C-1]
MFEVVKDSPRFVVVNKTQAQSFHAEDGPGFFVAVEAALGQKLWPVHRLDKVTTGLVLFAKDSEAAATLGRLFEERQIKKCYLALSDKKPSKKQGLIKGDMSKARRGAWRLQRTTQNPAITRFDSQALGDGLRLYRLWPHTGKTHQLRVAMKSLGAPILGDELYGGSPHQRVCLHAYALAFSAFGEAVQVLAAPDFLDAPPPPFEEAP